MTDKKNRNTFLFNWYKRYLTLDRWMAGKFMRVFLLTLGGVVGCFILFCALSYTLRGWSAGEVFIQMTNPTPSKLMNQADWFLIVSINLFGLFVVNGILLTLLVNWISNRRERFLNGTARYEIVKYSKFSVIIGGHHMAARLASRIMEKDNLDFILIQTLRSPADLRKEIYAEIKDTKKAADVIIYSGDSTSWHELEELNLVKAKEIYIIGEQYEIENGTHDSANLKCWELIRTNITEPKNIQIPCHIMFEEQSTFRALRTTDINIDDTKTFRFIPFNLYETWTQKITVGLPFSSKEDKNSIDYIPLDGQDGISFYANERVHLIISGTNKMASTLLTEAAHIAHFPNFFNPQFQRPRTLITVISNDVEQELMSLMSSIPNLFYLVRWRFVKAPKGIYPSSDRKWNIYDSLKNINQKENMAYPWHDPMFNPSYTSPFFGGFLGTDFIDIDLEFIEGNFSMASIRKYLIESCRQPTDQETKDKVTIAICNDNPSEALASAISLPEEVYSSALQILVEQKNSETMVEAIRKGATGIESAKFNRLRPFGMLLETDYLGLFEARLPRYVAFAYDSLNNNSSFMKEYDKAPDIESFDKLVDENWLNMSREGGKSCIAKRWSNFYSANNFYPKLRSVASSLDDESEIKDSFILEILSKTEHNRWVMEQLLLGMTPPGREYAEQLPIEDPNVRKILKSQGIHPDLISNDKLGKTSQYDVEIVKIIPLAIHLSNNQNT